MKSTIEQYLHLELNPVAVIVTDNKPDKALQYKPGKFACAMRLVAQVAKGKTAVFDADTSGCFTASSALGLAKLQDKWPLGMDYYYAMLSCGMKDEGIDDNIKALITGASEAGAAPRDALKTLLEGEGYKKTRELVKEYVDSLPDIQISEKYVVMKPLKDVDFEAEKPVQIIFFVNPNQLSALIMLANFSVGNTDMVKVITGSACQGIGIYAYRESTEKIPRAILGLTDVYARNNIRQAIGDDKMTLTIPIKLFLEMEENADESLLARDIWKGLAG